MTSQEHEPTSTSRVRDYRKRMRELGMRPIQVWVVDVRASSFVADAHRQSAAVAGSDRADDDQAFIDALGDSTTPDEAGRESRRQLQEATAQDDQAFIDALGLDYG